MIRWSGLLMGMVAGLGIQVASAADGPLLAEACAGCHGQAGEGRGATPPIAGYDRGEFLRIWAEFRADARPATIMNRIAPGYSDEEAEALADYFASLR